MEMSEPAGSRVSPEEMERLSFARYLFRMATDQAAQSEPTNAIAVLLLHDSAELFLQLVAERYGKAGKRSPPLMEYFPLLKGALPEGKSLVYDGPIARMNDARNLLKHRGVRPATREIDGFHEATKAFFEANTPLTFGIAFGSISMARLVTIPEVREHLEKAELLSAAGDLREAVLAAATAYAFLERAYLEASPASAPPALDLLTMRHDISLGYHVGRLVRHIGHLTRAVRSIEEYLAKQAVGTSTAHQRRFSRLVPNVAISFAGTPLIQSGREARTPTDDDARFCYEYVVEVALTLQRRHQQDASVRDSRA